jgi:hypothetical protein
MRGVVCAAPAAAASLALWERAGGTRGAAAQGPRQGDRPVEQTRKNIQVLKGLPESRLFPEMNFIAASLGVQCGFCHVSRGRDPQTGQTHWAWESDEQEHKKVAREMMRMTLTDAILNQLPEQIDFEDYREAEGVKLPFTVRTSAVDTYDSFTRKLTEVRAGVPVEDELFHTPPASPAPEP